MARKIKESDIFQGDIFANAKKSADSYLGSLNALQGELKEMLTINKAMLDQSTKQLKTTSDLQKRTNAIQQVTKADKGLVEVEKEKIRVEQELEKLNQQRQKTEQQRNKTIVQNRKEEERLAKIKAKNLKLAKQEGQAYSQMSKKLTQLRNKYKNLATQNKQNTKEGQRLLKTIQQLDGRLKRIDKSVGQSQRNVGNYTSAWGKLGMRLKSVASAFGLIGGVMGAVAVIKGAFNIVKEFNQQLANLKAISGAIPTEMKAMEKSARELGASTRYTASQVAGLQIELSKLGFNPQQILESTEAILQMATATGTDLANASQIAGSTLRAFNLDATEMDRVASVMAVATSKSALNMEFLQTAMSKVAPVSSAMGFSIEDTTALLGTLSNAGFDASSSATATRNIMLKMADSSGDLAQALGRPIKSLDDLAPALKELEESGIDIGEALELTDRRSVSAFKTLLQGTDVMLDLRDGITDSEQALKDMANIMEDTLQGDIDKLNSAWSEMILGTADNTDGVNKLRGAIRFLTKNLSTIIQVIYYGIKALIIFKATQFAVNTAMTVGRVVMVAYRVSLVAMNRGVKSANRMLKIFNTTMKSNPIGLLIAGLTTAIALLMDFGGETDEATKKAESLEKAVKKLNDEFAQSKSDIADQTKELEESAKLRISQINKEIALLEQEGATVDEIAKKEQEKNKISEDALQLQVDQSKILFDEQTNLAEERAKTITKNMAKQTELYELKVKQFSGEEGIASERALNWLKAHSKKYKALQSENEEINKSSVTQHANLKIAEDEYKVLYNQWLILKNQNETRDIRNNLNKEQNKTVAYYRQLIKDENEQLENVVTSRKQAKIHQKEIVRLERQITKILGSNKKGGDKINDSLKKREAYEKEINKLIKERRDVIEAQSTEGLDRQLNRLETEINNEMENAQEISKNKEIVRNTNDLADLTQLKTLLDLKLELQERQIDDSADYEKMKLEELSDEKLIQIAKDVKAEKITQKQADALIIADQKLLREKLDLIDQKRVNDKAEINETIVKEYEDSHQEIIDITNATRESIQTEDKVVSDKDKEILQQRLDAYKEFTNQIIQLINKQTDAKIKAIDKELGVSEKREDELRKLAQKGTITAQQSLASEQKRQAELERQKEELEKKKIRRQAILSGLDLLSNKIDNDEPDAVASTIRDIASLIAIISNLPAFAEGTEYIERGNAPKGTDKIIARVDEGERIMTKEQNKQLTGISNDELTKIAQDYKLGSFNDVQYIKPKQKELHTPFQSTSMILEKFDSLQKTIENKPMLTEVKWDDISQMIVEKVETKNRIENRHKSSKGIF